MKRKRIVAIKITGSRGNQIIIVAPKEPAALLILNGDENLKVDKLVPASELKRS